MHRTNIFFQAVCSDQARAPYPSGFLSFPGNLNLFSAGEAAYSCSRAWHQAEGTNEPVVTCITFATIRKPLQSR